MLSLGHDFPFGFEGIAEDTRLRAVRAAGFDAVMFHWQGAGDAGRRLNMIGRAGLRVRTVHFPQEEMMDFWRAGETGERLERQLLEAVRALGGWDIPHLVVHTTRRDLTPEPNETGLRRFARAAEAGERYGVDIALENTRYLRYNRYLFERIASPRLGFCFDCGHAQCFTPGEDPLGLFGDRLRTTHLHDNDGSRDEHRLIGEGSVDLRRVFLRLRQLDAEDYNLESRYAPRPGERPWTLEEYLERAYTRLSACLRQAEEDINALS